MERSWTLELIGEIASQREAGGLLLSETRSDQVTPMHVINVAASDAAAAAGTSRDSR